MKFSVIIPTYNDWERLTKCLNALQQQTISRDQYEVIVVDNGERGEIPSGITLPDWVRLIHEPKPGSYIARNTGAYKARGEFLAFTDSDCIPDINWLANAEKCFNRSSCDLVGGKVQIFQDDEQNKYGYLYESSTAFPQHKNVPAGKGVTANLFVKKQVFNERGGFSSTIKSGGDWEFTKHCTNNGHKMVYCKDVMVLHPARTIANIFKKQRRLTCGGALNMKEKFGHSYLRMLGSHLIHGPKYHRENISGELSKGERVVVYSIDMLKYTYRALLYSGMFLRLIDPTKIRE